MTDLSDELKVMIREIQDTSKVLKKRKFAALELVNQLK